MKTTKRTTIEVETFERLVIQFNQTPPKVFCESCQQPIFCLPITKIAFVQTVSESDTVYLFVTESGMCFFLEIL